MRRLLAVLFTSAPFVAGVVAALSARRDMRMLWMAAAATVGVRLVAALTPSSVDVRKRWMFACIAGTFVASAVAVVLGAHAPFGVGAVAVVLALFATAGAALSGSLPVPA